MSAEIVCVESFRGSTLVSKSTYTDYDKALNYAKRRTALGYRVRIKRQVDSRAWSIIWFYPSETL